MTLCICDGPAHPYTPSWCGEGRSASSPHGPINLAWRTTPTPSAAPSETTSTPAAKWYKQRLEAQKHISYLRQIATEYEDDGLLDEADRLIKIADFLEGNT